MQLGDVQHMHSAAGCKIESRAERDTVWSVVILFSAEDSDIGQWWR